MLTQAQYHAKYYETTLKVGDRVDHVNGGYGEGEGYVSRVGTVTAITHTEIGVNVTVAHDECGTCKWEAHAMRSILMTTRLSPTLETIARLDRNTVRYWGSEAHARYGLHVYETIRELAGIQRPLIGSLKTSWTSLMFADDICTSSKGIQS